MNELVLHKHDPKEVMHSLQGLFQEYGVARGGINRLSQFVKDKDGLIDYFLTGNDSGRGYVSAVGLFEEKGAVAALNSEYWSRAMDLTDILECMPADDRNQWSEDIQNRSTPPFDQETVLSTFEGLMLSRGSFFAKKVDGVFRNLSGNHVTNSPTGFKKRMIVEYVLEGQRYDWLSVNYSRAQYICDLRTIIAKLMGREEAKTSNTLRDLRYILSAKGFGQWYEFDGGAFKVRLYKKGTAHIEVHPTIAMKMNRVLATLHPGAIPSQHRQPTKAVREGPPLHTDILPYEVTDRLENIVDRDRHGEIKEFYSGDTPKDLEAVYKFLGGVKVKDQWTFSYCIRAALIKIVRTGVIPGIKSHQFYPTPEIVRQLVHDMADIQPDDSVLEPSAGHGNLLDGIVNENITCVEVNSLNAAILNARGYLNVYQEDFMKFQHEGVFSKIIMNPPFGKNQAKSHVIRAAEKYLAEWGRLVAVLPATLKDKEFVKGHTHEYSEVIGGAFEESGTMVNVVILTLMKE